MLNPELRERLWPFLGGIAKQNPGSFKRLMIFAFSMRQELNKAIDRADGVIPI
jgi:hypothetical protein